MYLYVFWLRKRPSIKYVRNFWGDGGSSKIHTDAYRGGGATSCMMYALRISLYIFLAAFFLCSVLVYLWKFNLTFILKNVSVRKSCFTLKRSISVVMKYDFSLKTIFVIKVSQNTFNFNEIES